MALPNLGAFLESSGGMPYRKLIEQHVRQKSAEEIAAALARESDMLPLDFMPYIFKFTDAVRARLANDQDFWESASCRTASARITDVVGDTIPYDTLLDGFARTIRDSSPDVSLGMFHVATLHLALLASLHRESRQIMGF